MSLQASFDLPVPAVLGEAGRQAVQCRVAPGVNRVRGIEQLTRAARVLDCLSLLGRADRAQTADNRAEAEAACPAGPPPSFPIVSGLVKEPSPGFGSRSAIALVSRSR